MLNAEIQEIASGETSILNVVKALGVYLTSEEGELRAKGDVLHTLLHEHVQMLEAGVEFLSLVLTRCPSEKLTRQSGGHLSFCPSFCHTVTRGFSHSVRVLVNFYRDKLDDTETIIPALKGLKALASLTSCPSNDATNILHA
jgi:DNA repair/transcription protein MET18/MMS19